jgi:hypothetical protein
LKFSLRKFIGHFFIIEQIYNVAFTIEKVLYILSFFGLILKEKSPGMPERLHYGGAGEKSRGHQRWAVHNKKSHKNP